MERKSISSPIWFASGLWVVVVASEGSEAVLCTSRWLGSIAASERARAVVECLAIVIGILVLDRIVL